MQAPCVLCAPLPGSLSELRLRRRRVQGGRELQGSIRDALVQLEAESTAGGAEGRVRDIIGRCRGAGAAIGPSVVARISAKCFQVQVSFALHTRLLSASLRAPVTP